MTVTEFILKHNTNQKAIAALLDMSITSVNNKLHGNGKSKPFTESDLEALERFIIQSIGIDLDVLRDAKRERIQLAIDQKTKELHEKTEELNALVPVRS